MKPEAYGEMYENEDIHWWFVSRRAIIRKMIDRYIDGGDTLKILEAGCGSGGNLSMLDSYGELYAMEMDDNARRMANSRNVCHVKKGSLPHDIPFNYEFDLICMLDVLEHIDEDAAALEAIQKQLKPGGKLIITVPAYQFLWSGHDSALQHKRRYVKNRLTSLVSRSGLAVGYATYFNTILFPAVFLVRMLNNIKGKNDGSDVYPPSAPVNHILKTIFSIERTILPKIVFPFGVSILLIAVKKVD